MAVSMVASPNPVPDAHPPIGARVMLTENVTIDCNDQGQPQVFDAGQRGTVDDLYDQMLWVKLDGTHAGLRKTGGCLVFHLRDALPVQVLSEGVELDDLITTVREDRSDTDQTPTERPRLRRLEPEGTDVDLSFLVTDVDLSFLGTEPLPDPPQVPTPQPAQTRLAFSPEVVAVNAILLQRDALQARHGCESAAHRYNVRLRNLARTLARHAAEEEEPSLAEALPPLRALALAVMLMMFCGALGRAGSLRGQGALHEPAPGGRTEVTHG